MSNAQIRQKALTTMPVSTLCIPNTDSTLYLCVADDDPQMDPLRKVYVVYDNEGRLLLDKKRVHGEVKWKPGQTHHIQETIYDRRIENIHKNKPPKTNTIEVYKYKDLRP